MIYQPKVGLQERMKNKTILIKNLKVKHKNILSHIIFIDKILYISYVIIINLKIFLNNQTFSP